MIMFDHAGDGLYARLAADWRANAAVLGVGSLLTARWWAVLWFRLSQATGRRSRLGAGCIKQLNQVITGADIAWDCEVGGGLVLYHPVGVVIGSTVVVGSGCHLQQGVTLGAKHGGRGAHEPHGPTLGRDVHLGAGARVLGNVAIGDRVAVGANAVVITDVPSDCIAVGVPARFRSREGSRKR